MSSPGDFPDWTQPVAASEVVTAINPTGGQLVPNGGGVSAPTAGASSLSMWLSLGTAPAGTRYELDFGWNDGVQTYKVDRVTFHSAASYPTGLGQLGIQLPVRAQFVDINLTGSAAGNLNCDIELSNRSVAGMVITHGQADGGDLLLDTGNVVIPANGSSPAFYIPPVTRAFTISERLLPAGLSVSLSGVYSSAGTLTGAFFHRTNGSATPTQEMEIAAPGIGQEIGITNTGAGALTARLSFWDVS